MDPDLMKLGCFCTIGISMAIVIALYILWQVTKNEDKINTLMEMVGRMQSMQTKKELDELMKLDYPVSYTKEKGYYYVWHEDLPGCRADGVTLEEAKANLALVREDWIKLALERGMKVPKPKEEK